MFTLSHTAIQNELNDYIDSDRLANAYLVGMQRATVESGYDRPRRNRKVRKQESK
jgi:hypothetical protein